MTLVELKQILEQTGYPVAYYQFHVDENNPAPETPFIVYLVDYSDNRFADNKIHTKVNNILIELYTDKKDLEVEKTLEDILDQHDICWNVDEIYIDSEKLFQRIYQTTIF